MKKNRGQALVEFLVCGAITLTLAYLTAAVSFKILFNTIMIEWIDEYFLCQLNQSAQSAKVSVCVEQLSQRLRHLKVNDLRINLKNEMISLEFQHFFFNMPKKNFIARCPLKNC